MSNYQDEIKAASKLIANNGTAFEGINPEYAARMRVQNRFQTGIEIARYTAGIMRQDMADYDADSAQYTQSLGCWHGFIAQQKMIAVKKHHGTTSKRYLYLSGWMIAALRSEFGSLGEANQRWGSLFPFLALALSLIKAIWPLSY